MGERKKLNGAGATRSAAPMRNLRTLIVDGDELSRRRIKKFLDEIPNVELIGECKDGVEGVRVIRAEAPDLILLDVQMPRMGGFDLLSAVGPGAAPMCIFITASDHFALRAFEFRALDYVLKPVSRKRFKQAIERALTRLGHTPPGCTSQCQHSLRGPGGGGPRYLSHFEIKLRGRIRLLDVTEVDWIGGASNYVEIHIGQKSYLMREKLSRLCELVDPARFVRIHRSTVVNIDRVAELAPLFNGDHAVFLRDGMRLVLSRTNCDKFLSLLKNR